MNAMRVNTASSRSIIKGVAAAIDCHVAGSCGTNDPSTPFDGVGMESLAISDFLSHILKSGLCSKECLVMALVYIERLVQQHPEVAVSPRNAHRLVLVSVMVGSKILDDFYCRNMYYAVTGSISRAELNEMELQFCFLLDFELDVSVAEFAVYHDAVACGHSGAVRSAPASPVSPGAYRLPVSATAPTPPVTAAWISPEKTQPVALWMRLDDDVWRSGSTTPSPVELAGVPDPPRYQLPAADPLGAANAWFKAEAMPDQHPWNGGNQCLPVLVSHA